MGSENNSESIDVIKYRFIVSPSAYHIHPQVRYVKSVVGPRTRCKAQQTFACMQLNKEKASMELGSYFRIFRVVK